VSASALILAPVVAMLDELDGPALGELEHALRGQLAPAPETPAERRVRQLGLVAQLIRETGAARPPRTDYDQLRPADAPSSQALVEEYGRWRKVCRAAEGLLPDGRILRTDGNTRVRNAGIRTKTRSYSRNEIANAIRQCALATGRRPTSLSYERWRDREVAQAKQSGREMPRLPTLITIARWFRAWPQALAAAAIDERGLERERAKRLPRSDRRPQKLTATELERVGATRLLTRTGNVDKTAIEQLPLRSALDLCRALDCSLNYLAGAGDRGRAPVGTRFAHETWKTRLAASGVGERELLKRIGMPLGPYRQLLRGKHEPTLRQLQTFAAITAAPLTALLTEGDTP
jgi:transcriptional regulator with XRE-family HTH domain